MQRQVLLFPPQLAAMSHSPPPRGANWAQNRQQRLQQAEFRRLAWERAAPGDVPEVVRRKTLRREEQRRRQAARLEQEREPQSDSARATPSMAPF